MKRFPIKFYRMRLAIEAFHFYEEIQFHTLLTCHISPGRQTQAVAE